MSECDNDHDQETRCGHSRAKIYGNQYFLGKKGATAAQDPKGDKGDKGDPSIEVSGISGTPLLQAFTVTGNIGDVKISFPKPFKEGTVPVVTASVNREDTGSQCTRVVSFEADSSINNTGCACQIAYINGNAGSTTENYMMNIIAIGEAP